MKHPPVWKKNLFPLFLLGFFIISVCNTYDGNAQVLKGKIKDINGQPVPYATILTANQHNGSIANLQGEYELTLDTGIYTIQYRAVGYKSVFLRTRITAGTKKQDVVLPQETYAIGEVIVRPNTDDLVRQVMRKTIAWAPYHLNQISHYASEVYLKGSLVFNKIPKILAKRITLEVEGKEVHPYSGMSFVDESVNEVIFDAPDKFRQTVKSVRSTMPLNEGKPITPMELIKESFYEPGIIDCISPLAPEAFSHYRFQYEGASKEGDNIVYKIGVIPRRKSQQLFSGHIYILDRLWCLYSVSLTLEQFWGKAAINQVYAPFENNAWLPVTHSFFIDASYLGIQATYNYSATVKYMEVNFNTKLTGPVPVGNENKQFNGKQETTVQKETQKLAAKDDLSLHDMKKLARSTSRENSKARNDSAKSLEIKPHVAITMQPNALARDTSYWNKVRPVPLTPDDLRGFHEYDSIRSAIKGSSPADSLARKRNHRSLPAGILAGNTWRLCDSTLTLRYRGLLNPGTVGFNTVDGWRLQQSVYLEWKTDSLHELAFIPTLTYAFARKSLLSDVIATYSYAPMRRGYVFIHAGISSADFNAEAGIHPFVNTLSSLLFRENYLKLTDRRIFAAGTRIDIANGLQASLAASYIRYAKLDNVTNYSFFYRNKEYSSNVPGNPWFSQPHDSVSRASMLNLAFEYTPEYYYVVRHHRKIMVRSKYPSFGISYTLAVPGIAGSKESFGRLEGSIKQHLQVGLQSELRYSLNAGVFTQVHSISFPSFRHFATEPVPVYIGSMNSNFQLLNFYRYSTSDKYLEGHVSFSSSLLLLKRLPYFSNRIWSENLFLNYLAVPGMPDYLETGYGLGNVMGILNLGIFCSFDSFSFQAAGFRISLPLGFH